jgi:hypothetical protein
LDWKQAIEINRLALARIVAELVSLLAAQGDGVRVSLSVYQLIARILFPAESAVRRLIVIAARGLVVPVPQAQPMPPGIFIQGKCAKATARMAFQLFDTRKHFGDNDDAPMQPKSYPRIRVVGDADPRSLFMAKFDVPGAASETATQRLRLRLAALMRALDTLPHQAQRLVRWRARRAALKNPKFLEPLRPGPPPGHRQRPRDQIDVVLKECHALARQALSADTS